MIGSLLAEKYDFGTPQSVNSLYRDLLAVTPFSQKEKRRYEAVLNDRNLVVHHGGIYTMRYARQKPFIERVHFDSLPVTPAVFLETAAFVDSIVQKMVRSTHSAVVHHIDHQKIPSSGIHAEAVSFLAWIE
jgi:hypothetical protein